MTSLRDPCIPRPGQPCPRKSALIDAIHARRDHLERAQGIACSFWRALKRTRSCANSAINLICWRRWREQRQAQEEGC